MTTPSALLLAHALFPEFPSLGMLLLTALVVGSAFAIIARRRSKTSEVDIDDAEEEVTTTIWWRIPFVTLIACSLAVPLSLVPMVGLPANIILIPGWILLWMLLLSDVLRDDSDALSFVVMAAASWIFWTAAATIISSVIARFRSDVPPRSTINSIR